MPYCLNIFKLCAHVFCSIVKDYSRARCRHRPQQSSITTVGAVPSVGCFLCPAPKWHHLVSRNDSHINNYILKQKKDRKYRSVVFSSMKWSGFTMFYMMFYLTFTKYTVICKLKSYIFHDMLCSRPLHLDLRDEIGLIKSQSECVPRQPLWKPLYLLHNMCENHILSECECVWVCGGGQCQPVFLLDWTSVCVCVCLNSGLSFLWI